MSWSRWYTVFKKEVTENLRDRRTLLTTFVFGPLFGPVLFAAMAGVGISLATERAEKPLELPVVNAELAPNFVNWLSQQGVVIKPAPADPEAAIRRRDFDTILRISPEYPKQWQAGNSADIEVLFDPSRQTAAQAISRTQALLGAYGRQIGVMRLLARGISPEAINPVQVRQTDLSTPQSRSALVLATLPYLLFFTVFMGGMSLAIDVTAGERERQSLEPLLANPVARGQIMFGKVCAAAAFSMASLLLTLLLFALSFRLVPLEQLGMKIALDGQAVLLMLLMLMPLCFLASAAQTALAAFAKSFREAQTQVSLLMMVPALPALFMAINPIKPKLWYYTIPFFGQNFLIDNVVRGEAVEWMHVAISVACSILGAILMMLIAARMYKRESLAVSV
jgi:sodium transport system permease protein